MRAPNPLAPPDRDEGAQGEEDPVHDPPLHARRLVRGLEAVRPDPDRQVVGRR